MDIPSYKIATNQPLQETNQTAIKIKCKRLLQNEKECWSWYFQYVFMFAVLRLVDGLTIR